MSAKKEYEGCEVCGKDLLLFKCKYCGKAYCEQHKAPEKHECQGMMEYRRQLELGTIGRPGTEPGVAPEPAIRVESPQPQQPSLVRKAYKGTVLAVKVLSVIAVMAASAIALILLVGYINANTPTYQSWIPVNNASGAQVMLFNYKNATDPTYDDLMAFLRADDTIEIAYDYPRFTCADFARTLHDRAEARGIKCGFAVVEFVNATLDYNVYDNGGDSFRPPSPSSVGTASLGHGLNVFNTVDKGQVFIDASSQSDFVGDQPQVRVAYVQDGKELNGIDIDWAADKNYSFYETYKQEHLTLIGDEQAYFRDRSAYEADLKANGNVSTEELKRRIEELNARAIELNARKARIGPFYFPTGLIKNHEIYW